MFVGSVFSPALIRSRTGVRLALAVALTGSLTAVAPVTAHAATGQVDVALRVLVLDDGAPMVGAIVDRMKVEGVPYTRIDLSDAGRTTLTADALATSDAAGIHAKYVGVVAPSEAPAQLNDAERKVLHEYEQTFRVRELNAYTWAHPEVGLNYAGYTGKVDGMAATVTPAGLDGPFRYLQGPVRLDDLDPAVDESWGYLGTPVTPTATSGTFTPLVTAPIPGSGAAGSLMGVFAKDGREQLVVTFAQNAFQQHWRTFGHGVLTWLTRGMSTSLNRNYLSAHIDDVLLPDSRWNSAANCTSDECPTPTDDTIRMVPADVTRLVNWQNSSGIKLDMTYNGAGTADSADPATGKDALTDALLASKSQFRWINHTWSHPYLGCLQNFTVNPWQCQVTNGAIAWMTRTQIATEITKNRLYARDKALPNIAAGELVTGEHSGLASLPQMPTDNPNLGPALNDTRVQWVASDASREMQPRKIGRATTVPRYPMNIFYNTGTKAEAVDEYNWIYTSAANGGSGLCEQLTDTMTCIDPLDPSTGFDSTIVPVEARIATRHVLGNDPRPHYAHQSNLAEDGILYPVLDQVIAGYRATFAANAPLINPTMTAAGTALIAQQTWATAQKDVRATVSGTTVTVTNTGAATTVPVTLPDGTRTLSATGSVGGVFGEGYAGERSATVKLGAGATNRYRLPADPGFATSATWPVPVDAPAGTPDPAVQQGQTTEVVPLPEADTAVLPADQASTAN